MTELSEIMTIEEVAKYLRVSNRTVYEWAQKGKIPCGRLGTNWRFKRDDILSWVDSQLKSNEVRKQSYSPLLLSELLMPEDVIIKERACKDEILTDLTDLISSKPVVSSKSDVVEGIFHREQMMSTGIGIGIAIPHVRLSSVSDISVAVGLVRGGILDYQTIDKIPVKLVFMIVARIDQHEEHLKLVSQISVKLKDEERRMTLFSCRSQEEFIETLRN